LNIILVIVYLNKNTNYSNYLLRKVYNIQRLISKSYRYKQWV